MNRTWSLAAVVLLVALAAACSQKEPAQQAVDAAEQALSEIHEAALKYAPDEYGELKAELDAARKALQEEKFAEAIAAARDLPVKAREVGVTAEAAREALLAELQVTWGSMTEELPARLAQLERRVAELDRAKRLPKDIERKAVDQARSGIDFARQAWEEAQSVYGQADLEGAVARARASDLLITRMLQTLGIEPDAEARPAG